MEERDKPSGLKRITFMGNDTDFPMGAIEIFSGDLVDSVQRIEEDYIDKRIGKNQYLIDNVVVNLFEVKSLNAESAFSSEKGVDIFSKSKASIEKVCKELGLPYRESYICNYNGKKVGFK